MRTLLMFFPLPELARLGDPLPIAASSGKVRLEEAVDIVEKRIIDRLGVSGERGRIEGPWPWAVALERLSGNWAALEKALNTWLRTTPGSGNGGENEQTSGISRAIHNFFRADGPPVQPNRRQVRELAEVALLGPGNVLYRAVGRVFGERDDLAKRIELVTSTSVTGLRTYFDLADFHLLLRDQQRYQHPAAIRRAVWDGNLESTLDEYLSTLRGLGTLRQEHGVEEKILLTMNQALTIGAGRVLVRETGSEVSREPFRIRCHAALPFGLADQERESGSGELHSDALRISFNSPFRPYVLATTSIGQEGLDFHVWSRHVIHWDLPSNPVDLEQREGRVDRYAGLAVRHALAKLGAKLPASQSPWRTLAESQEESLNGLAPWWICKDASIRRSVLVPPFSRIADDLQVLRDQLSVYRLALGQADQEALMHVLQRRVEEAGEDEKKILAWLDEARIDLAPKCSPSTESVR